MLGRSSGSTGSTSRSRTSTRSKYSARTRADVSPPMPAPTTIACLPIIFAIAGPLPESAGPELDQHGAVGIGPRGLERMHYARGVRHQDDRRPRHDVAGHQTLAPEHGRLLEVTELRPVDRTPAGPRRARRLTLALGHGHDARLGADRRGAHAVGDDLHARLVKPRALAVHRLVAPVEVGDQLGERGVIERARRHRHLDLVDLALVANVGRAHEPAIARRDAVRAQLGYALRLELAEPLHHADRVE